MPAVVVAIEQAAQTAQATSYNDSYLKSVNDLVLSLIQWAAWVKLAEMKIRYKDFFTKQLAPACTCGKSDNTIKVSFRRAKQGFVLIVGGTPAIPIVLVLGGWKSYWVVILAYVAVLSWFGILILAKRLKGHSLRCAIRYSYLRVFQ